MKWNERLSFLYNQVLDDDEEDEAADKKKDEPGPSKRVTKATVIDLLADEIEPLLRNHENVANLVLLSMVGIYSKKTKQKVFFSSLWHPIVLSSLYAFTW